MATAKLTVLLLSVHGSAAWLAPGALPTRPLARPRSAVHMSSMENDGESLPESSVDWDSAWQMELAKRKTGTASWRPEGREAVTEEQLAQAKANLRADDAAFALQQASADWRFWFGVIAVVSVVTAVLGHPSEEVYSI